MIDRTLIFASIRLNKKEFHKSKQPINLDKVNIDQIVKPLCIILLQMSGYIKYFENGGKNMSFIIKNDRVLDNYTEIWNKIKKILNIKFHSMPAYDEKYIKAKVKGSNGVAKPIFSS